MIRIELVLEETSFEVSAIVVCPRPFIGETIEIPRDLKKDYMSAHAQVYVDGADLGDCAVVTSVKVLTAYTSDLSKKIDMIVTCNLQQHRDD